MTDNYLKDFTETTPLTLIRIKESWDFLPFETKVKILKELLNMEKQDKQNLKYRYQANALKDLALNDENPYIRYLVAQTILKPFVWGEREETEEDREDKKRYDKVLSDKSELVRSVVEEGLRGFPDADDETAKSFWSLSHTKRLMSVSYQDSFDCLGGEVVAKILEYSATELLPKKKISAQEIIDIIQQYMTGFKESVYSKEKYIHQFMDGFADYRLGKDIRALWQVALSLPDAVGYDLIENLPIEGGIFMKESDIPIDDLKKLSEQKLLHLFYRDDLALNELRRKVYIEKTGEENESLRSAAISSISFKLDDDDFRKLVINKDDSEKEGKRKLKELKMLAHHCSGATLAQMEAIIDIIEDTPNKYSSGFSHSGEDAGFAHIIQESRIKKIGSKFTQELLDLRIYALASYLLNDLADNIFSFLKSDIVPGDRWGTYLKIRPKILNKTELHSKLPVLELQGKTYPLTEGEIEEEIETNNTSIPMQNPSWESHFRILEKKLKWIFWIGIAILFFVISHR